MGELVPISAPKPPLETLKALVLDSVTSPHSRRAYRKALDDFLAWFSSGTVGSFTKAAVQAYRAELEKRGLSPSTINIRLAAIRKLAIEATDNGLLAPEIAAGIARVRGAKRLGVRAGNWLTKAQAEQLLRQPNVFTLKGKRDRALLALMIGCGLRRNEVSELAFEDVQQRDGRWAVVDLVGKHGRVRTVPMPGWTKAALDHWAQAGGLHTGRIFHALKKGDRVMHASMTPQSIFQTVVSYGHQIGVEITPHDLRRTFAKLAYKGHSALEQIQLSLGHASILTTERYLGVSQDLSDAPCDHLGLEIEGS